MKRIVFESLQELVRYMREHPHEVKKKIPYRVVIEGVDKYVLAGNSDQAIAAVARMQSIRVETVAMGQILTAG